ncbi:peptidoglycan-binding protein [Sedimenticola selenatireducens]|uniref:Peptidoglycan binding-like domain-containing protein n=1 Tax=Sedimenticola selenatireducens TaxID=191960 RepID=A0A2N6D1H3_9GAMM|nr:DUF4852 domain-containing protein [Sedimenticola selenatireducens]PLX63556.1 MAG: hypothetical protein C0630_01245 [Sedimenticola selenatireducens]
MRILASYLIFLLFASPANAGFFDDLLGKAKRAADEVVGDSVDNIMGESPKGKQQQPSQEQPDNATTVESKKETTTKPPTHDKALVKSIQQNLKEQGYKVGVVDGLYGVGTKKAIQAYQLDHGLKRDGLASHTLLTRLQQTQGNSSMTQTAASTDAGLLEPTIAALQLAAVHYRPETLDKESNLKRVLLRVHPEYNNVVGNEFKWQKQKDQLKSQLLEEAKNVSLRFEVMPWREDSVARARPLELQKYDFDKSAFFVQFATGNFRSVLIKMLIPGDSSLPAQYPQQINWIAVNSDKAEQISDYFGKKQRKLYPGYRFKVIGTDISSSIPVPIIEFEGDQLDLYAMESIPQGNMMKTEFKLMARAAIPVDKAVAAAESKKVTFDSHKASDTDVIKNASIDGVSLGMDVDKAVHSLQSRGIKMNGASKYSKLTGVTIEGSGKTADGKGWLKVMIRQMDGKVYQYQKSVGYLLDRLPLTDGTRVEDLKKRYQDEFILRFADSRYSYTDPYGKVDFDDETQPPYNRKVTSPHITSNVAAGNGRFSATMDMHWKNLVGANW